MEIKNEQKESTPNDSAKSKKQSFWELVRFAIVAVLIVIPIRMFIAQPFIVSGSSMAPTFDSGDYLVVDEISYRLKDPKRYEVVIFRYPNDPGKYFIKRIIGLPNETVEISGNIVTIFNDAHPDGFVIEQPFVKLVGNNDLHFELEEEEYFVMGDNRGASSDSRYWGAVPRELLSGRALLRLLPINDIGILPGNYQQNDNK